MSTQYQNQSVEKILGVVDICFLIDATASMQPCIYAIKDNIRAFIKIMTSQQENGGIVYWRACIWGYRDYTYDPAHGREALVKNNFTSDVSELERQLQSLKAEGGGPVPESLLDALLEVSDMGETAKDAKEEADKWRCAREAARCVIVVTDAPFYPTLERFPGAGVEDIIKKMEAARIRLGVIAPPYLCYDALAQMDKCEYMDVEVPGTPLGKEPSPDACIAALRDYMGAKENVVWELLARTCARMSTSIAPDVYFDEI